MFKAVLFDFGGVIVPDYYYPLINAQKRWLTAGQLASYQELEMAASIGSLSRTDFFSGFKEIFGLDFLTDLDTNVGKYYKNPDAGVLSIISKLKEKNIKVGLLSNNFSDWARVLKEQEYFKLFDPAIISCDVKLAKPDEKIFRLALERLGLEAGECVFVDDRDENILGAKNVGIKAIPFKNAAVLVKELKSLGLL